MNGLSKYKVTLSTVYSMADLSDMVEKQIIEDFYQKGLVITADDFQIDEANGSMRADFDIYNYSPQDDQNPSPADVRIEGAAKNLGYREFGDDNYTLAVERIFKRKVSLYADTSTDQVVIEFYQESDHIMDGLRAFYDDFDNLSADEAKTRLAGFYNQLNKNYGWRV